MIEEIDSETYLKHYFQKCMGELQGNPSRFLQAAIDFVQEETGQRWQLVAPAVATTIEETAKGRNQPAAAAAVPAAPPPEAAATQAQQQQQQQQVKPQPEPAAAAAPAAPAAAAPTGAEQQQEGTEAEAEPKGLKPNAGNGADLDTYSWTQTLQEVAVAVPLPPGTKGRMCDVQIARNKLWVGIKGQQPVLDGELFAAVKPDDCLWNLVDGRLLELTLQKVDSMQWWRSVIKGEPEIDTQSVEPESSKLTDLDPEMRATVEKMMYDQRQKALGLPTSEEQQKQEAMNRFMAAHPELDFSNAKFM